MFRQMRGLGAVYDIEGQIPTSYLDTSMKAGDPFQALPQIIDYYLQVKNVYLSLQNQSLSLAPVSQAGQLKEISIDVKRLQNDAYALGMAFNYYVMEHIDDPTVVNYAKNLIEKAGLQSEQNFKSEYQNLVNQLSTLTGRNVSELTITQSEQSQFASVIASLKAQLQLVSQQLSQTEATLIALRAQAAALGITSW